MAHVDSSEYDCLGRSIGQITIDALNSECSRLKKKLERLRANGFIEVSERYYGYREKISDAVQAGKSSGAEFEALLKEGAKAEKKYHKIIKTGDNFDEQLKVETEISAIANEIGLLEYRYRQQGRF